RAGDRPLRADRVRRPHGDHGVAADRLDDHPARTRLPLALTRRAIQETGAASPAGAGRSAVHWGHFLALNGIVEQQYEHSLVVGSSGPTNGTTLWIEPRSLTRTIYTASATIKNCRKSPMKAPTSTLPIFHGW